MHRVNNKVGDGEFSEFGAHNDLTGSQIQKVIARLFSCSGSKENTVQSSREIRVGWRVILIGLDVGAKADSEFTVVINNTMGDDGVGAQIRRDPALGWKQIQHLRSS